MRATTSRYNYIGRTRSKKGKSIRYSKAYPKAYPKGYTKAYTKKSSFKKIIIQLFLIAFISFIVWSFLGIKEFNINSLSNDLIDSAAVNFNRILDLVKGVFQEIMEVFGGVSGE